MAVVKEKKSGASKAASGASVGEPKTPRALKSEGEPLPSPEEAAAVFALALTPDLARPRSLLNALSVNPPQLIHLEGGETEQRVALALWWAALLNCEQPCTDAEENGPCLTCSACLRIGADMCADLVILDGRSASIKIDDVRALRPHLGEPPRFGRKRVIVMAEAQALGIEAANSLLKSLEEPCPDTCFVFTTPQRERLLPTLVSRGWVVTLPWPDPARALSPEMREWALALAEFADSGRGWFGKSSVKGALDASRAQEVVLAGQKALSSRLAGRSADALARVLDTVPEDQLMGLDELFARCQEALQAQVNPALVMDYMATHLHLFVHARGTR